MFYERYTERVTRVTEDIAPSAFSLRNSLVMGFPTFPAPTIAKLVKVDMTGREPNEAVVSVFVFIAHGFIA